jgi:hypothetical protein
MAKPDNTANEQLINEWLSKNKPTRIPEGQRTDPADMKPQWGKPRKKVADKTVDKSK